MTTARRVGGFKNQGPRRRGLAASVAIMLAFIGVFTLPVAAEPQAPPPSRSERFASRVVASRSVPRDALVALARDPDPVNRQCAMLQLAEGTPPTADEIDALVRGLGDADERVRLQALAGLMRVGEVATGALIRALEDHTSAGNFGYRSEAMNGTRGLPLEVADLATAALTHSVAVDTSILLRAYAALPADPATTFTPTDVRSLRGSTARPRPSSRTRLLMVLERGRITMGPELTNALGSSDQRLASGAARRLGQFGGEAAAAASALADAAGSHAADGVREAASRALTRIGAPGADALRRLLTSAEPRTRRVVLTVLPLDAPDAGERVAAGLRDADPSVRAAALRRIREPIEFRVWLEANCDGGREFGDDISMADKAAFALVRRFLETLPTGTAEQLKRLLTDADVAVREGAVGALAIYGCVLREQSGNVAEPIARAVLDRASTVRAAAIRALRGLAAREVRPPASMLSVLLGAQAPASAEDRGMMLGVIAGMDVAATDRQRVVETLVAACLKMKGSSCSAVATGLAAQPLSADLAAERLAARLYTPAATDNDEFQFFEELESGHPAFRRSLEQLLVRRRDWVQLAAANLLAKHGWVSTAVMDALAAGAARHDGFAGPEDEAAAMLVALGDEGISRLLSILESSKTAAAGRSRLAYALGAAAKDSARVAAWVLSTASGATDIEVQKSALYHLDDLPGRPDSAIRGAIHAALGSPNAEVRRAAMQVCDEMALVPDDVMLRALADPSEDVRATAVALLARLPASYPDRARLARQALEDPVDRVRGAAFRSIAAMGAEGSDLLADHLERHEVTSSLLAALRPSPLFGRATTSESPARLGVRLIEALQRKAASVDSQLRFEIDRILVTRGAVATVDRAPYRDRLDAPDQADRASAATVLAALNEDVWVGDGRLLAVMMDTQVMTIIRNRLGSTLDDLYPPGFTYTSGRSGTLPVFPWPPPRGYSAVALQRSLLPLNADPTFGDVHRTLVNALSLASTGFTQGLFEVPGGFALVARMERIKSDGTPLPGQARWMKEGSPTLSLLEFLGDLFFERPGYFRVVAFVLTTDPNPGSDPAARLPQPDEGALVMPAALARTPVAGQELLALVYSFERRGNASIQAWQDGAPSPREHLERAGIWAALAVR